MCSNRKYRLQARKKYFANFQVVTFLQFPSRSCLSVVVCFLINPYRVIFPAISITSLHSIATTQLVLLLKFWGQILDLEVHKHFNKQFTVVQISALKETTLLCLKELLFTQSIFYQSLLLQSPPKVSQHYQNYFTSITDILYQTRDMKISLERQA